MKYEKGGNFIYRKHRWKLLRIMRSQIGWDAARHDPIYIWEVTFGNGAFIRSAGHKWMIIAIIKARFNLRKERPNGS